MSALGMIGIVWTLRYTARAANAAKRAADAAHDAVGIAKAVESGVLRIDEVQPLQPPNEAVGLKDRSSTRITFVNRGRTRVDLLQVSAFLRYLDQVPTLNDEKPSAAVNVAAKQISKALEGSGGSWTTPIMPCGEEDRLLDLTPGQPPVPRNFYAFGQVSYLTAFNETVTSDYCFLWDRTEKVWTYIERASIET